MKTFKHLCDIYGEQYHRISEVNITEPRYLHAIDPSTFGSLGWETKKTFNGHAGPKTAQLMSYGDAWRFWIVID